MGDAPSSGSSSAPSLEAGAERADEHRRASPSGSNGGATPRSSDERSPSQVHPWLRDQGVNMDAADYTCEYLDSGSEGVVAKLMSEVRAKTRSG